MIRARVWREGPNDWRYHVYHHHHGLLVTYGWPTWRETYTDAVRYCGIQRSIYADRKQPRD